MTSLFNTQKTTYVAFLRGINVGGNTMVTMTALKECFESLGFSDVQTYINSGNVIFRTRDVDLSQLEEKVEKALLKTFSLPISVVVRTFVQMQKLFEEIPVSWHTNTTQKCNVIFLKNSIDTEEITEGLNPKDGIEELLYFPGVLLWSANTSDLTRSSMLKLSSKPIYKNMTVRIFNTVKKVYELMKITNKLP